MRLAGLLATLLFALGTANGRGPAESAPTADAKPAAVRFDADISPILSRCRPCHYPGGVMHERLPFDNEAAVRKAGTKLFTRIKDEKERAMLRRFFVIAH